MNLVLLTRNYETDFKSYVKVRKGEQFQIRNIDLKPDAESWFTNNDKIVTIVSENKEDKSALFTADEIGTSTVVFLNKSLQPQGSFQIIVHDEVTDIKVVFGDPVGKADTNKTDTNKTDTNKSNVS